MRSKAASRRFRANIKCRSKD